MRRRHVLPNAMVWAAAIFAAAALKAPHILSLVLPMLAALSLLAAGPDACLNRSDVS